MLLGNWESGRGGGVFVRSGHPKHSLGSILRKSKCLPARNAKIRIIVTRVVTRIEPLDYCMAALCFLCMPLDIKCFDIIMSKKYSKIKLLKIKPSTPNYCKCHDRVLHYYLLYRMCVAV